jgi:hypothetical protein
MHALSAGIETGANAAIQISSFKLGTYNAGGVYLYDGISEGFAQRLGSERGAGCECPPTCRTVRYRNGRQVVSQLLGSKLRTYNAKRADQTTHAS